jgi:hypothetical protein
MVVPKRLWSTLTATKKPRGDNTPATVILNKESCRRALQFTGFSSARASFPRGLEWKRKVATKENNGISGSQYVITLLESQLSKPNPFHFLTSSKKAASSFRCCLFHSTVGLHNLLEHSWPSRCRGVYMASMERLFLNGGIEEKGQIGGHAVFRLPVTDQNRDLRQGIQHKGYVRRIMPGHLFSAENVQYVFKRGRCIGRPAS